MLLSKRYENDIFITTSPMLTSDIGYSPDIKTIWKYRFYIWFANMDVPYLPDTE